SADPSGLIYMHARYYDPQLRRFLSFDPNDVDPATALNFNRYFYAANSPYAKYDPSGRYTCSANQMDCIVIDAYVAGITEAMKNPSLSPDQYVGLNAVANYLGSPWQWGATITSQSLQSGAPAAAAPDGTISIDLTQLAHYDPLFYPGNPNKSSDQVDEAIGAGAIAHEAQHELNFMSDGVPTSMAAEYDNEYSAYQTQAAVGAGLGVNIGLSTSDALDSGAQSSTSSWCDLPDSSCN
ncbi:MAG: RHS repeat-associated core domain-containing protein, partial [Rudaea sp.]